jgi:pimeloyl-ACP methyl ester carboxylesterase
VRLWGQVVLVGHEKTPRVWGRLRRMAVVEAETRYARSGDVNIAYQVVGEGLLDLIYAPVISHLELAWEILSLARFLNRLGSIGRLITFNQRGTGMSDRIGVVPTLETRMDDIRAVMDAAGSERAALFGLGDAGPLCVLFAATYLERTAALVLVNSSPSSVRSPEVPWLPTRAETEQRAEEYDRHWGEPAWQEERWRRMNPGVTEDEARTWARVSRHSASPGSAAAYVRMNLDVNVGGVLSLIRTACSDASAGRR